MGYVQRQRDIENERQVRVRLTEEGRRLREKAFGTGLFDACGLTQGEFEALRESVVTLRNNLFKSIQK
jgi:DNA-binding MarR family transcriptional regulator